MITVHGRTRCQMYNGSRRLGLRAPGEGGGEAAGRGQRRHRLGRGCRQSALDEIRRRRRDGRARRLWPPLVPEAGRCSSCRNGERLPDPPLAHQLATCSSTIARILEHYGVQHGVKIARKHVAWYSKGLYGSNEFRTKINFMDDPKDVEAAILDFYTPQIERAAA